MAYDREDISGKLSRIEAKQDSLAESLNRHERWINDHDNWANGSKDAIYVALDTLRRDVDNKQEAMRREFSESVERFSSEMNSLKARISGVSIATAIIVVAVNIAVAIYAAAR